MSGAVASYAAVDLLYDAETEIIKDMIRLLRSGSVATAEWKLDRLTKFGAFKTDAQAIIAKVKKAIVSGVMDQIDESALSALAKSERMFEQARRAGATLPEVLPYDTDPALRLVIQTWQKKAFDQINLAMTTMLDNAGKTYISTINRTTMEVLTGAMTGREALAKTVREWSQQGIPSITDSAGRQWSTEAYAGMVIRSNVTRVAGDVQMERAKEYNSDLVEISSHAGARPLCAPYQGRIFSLSGSSDKYPPFSSTSYGEPAGILGINCGHMLYPFFEGISRQAFEPTENEAENEQVYKESQRQRTIERGIRAAKRDLAISQELGDESGIIKAKSLLRGRQATMREFIEETGRTRQRGREQIYSA